MYYVLNVVMSLAGPRGWSPWAWSWTLDLVLGQLAVSQVRQWSHCR